MDSTPNLKNIDFSDFGFFEIKLLSCSKKMVSLAPNVIKIS